MTAEQKAAYVFSQSVAALIEMEAMKAANAEREAQGLAQAYGDEAFTELLERSGVHHNAVIGTFRD